MIYRISAVALLVGMPWVASNNWGDTAKVPTEKIVVEGDKKAEEIPVSPRTLTILFAAHNYSSKMQAEAFVEIIYRESRFVIDATNSETGAYGLGQALPPEQMDVIAPDWRYNATTQLEWVKLYIKERYGTPLNALEHHDKHGWY